MSARSTHPGVVVDVDGSPSSTMGVRWAAREAAMRNVPLTLVHISSPPASGPPPRSPSRSCSDSTEKEAAGQTAGGLETCHKVKRNVAPWLPRARPTAHNPSSTMMGHQHRHPSGCVLTADILPLLILDACARGRDVADARWSAIAGQEAFFSTGVVVRPFGAATRRPSLGG